MIALLTTVDAVKLSAAQAILAANGIDAVVFDGAAGALWRSIVPLRLMVGEDSAAMARSALRAANFRPAADGDWDLIDGARSR